MTTDGEKCVAGAGTFTQFPNDGEFCHDECGKPEGVRCERMQSQACECGTDKCWTGSACEANR